MNFIFTELFDKEHTKLFVTKDTVREVIANPVKTHDINIDGLHLRFYVGEVEQSTFLLIYTKVESAGLRVEAN